jgi:transposase
VKGRSGGIVDDWLAQRPAWWRQQITVAAIDAFRGYANALAAGVPGATLVMDCFHAVALANRTVDAVRRRVQQEVLGHRGRRHDPLYRIRRVTLVGAERLNQRGWAKLIAGHEAGDPSGHLAAAWLAKELLRTVYAARTPEAARRALTRFYTHCADRSQVPELVTLATTISTWEPQVLAYHHTARASNGPTEAVNLLIEKVRRIGHGFRNFDNYRLRLLLTCGIKWEAPKSHDSEDPNHAPPRRDSLTVVNDFLPLCVGAR